MKKKKINDGLRNLPKNFVTESELEENIKTEINIKKLPILVKDNYKQNSC